MIELKSDLVSLSGVILYEIQCQLKLLYGLAYVNNKLYVAAHETEGGVYEIEVDLEKQDHSMLKVIDNGSDLCGRVHSLTNYYDNTIAYSDTECHCVRIWNPESKNMYTIVGNDDGTRDGSKGQLSQPTGLCSEFKTLYIVDSVTAALRMVSGVNSLLSYLKHLYDFAITFGLHLKKELPVAFNIGSAIERLTDVYRFDCKCVQEAKELSGSIGVTQGPQGTVSSVVMDDENRLLESLCDLKSILNRFNPA